MACNPLLFGTGKQYFRESLFICVDTHREKTLNILKHIFIKTVSTFISIFEFVFQVANSSSSSIQQLVSMKNSMFIPLMTTHLVIFFSFKLYYIVKHVSHCTLVFLTMHRQSLNCFSKYVHTVSIFTPKSL